MYRILIADDELLECKGLEHIIRKCFPEIEILPSVYNGVDLLKRLEKEEPDIILMDINMPGLNGIEALEIIRLRQLKTRVIIVSAYSEFDYAQKAIKLEASDYILKPVEKETLENTIKKQITKIEQEKVRQKTEKKQLLQESKYQKLLSEKLAQEWILNEIDQAHIHEELEQLNWNIYGAASAAVSCVQTVRQDEIYCYIEQEFQKLCQCFGQTYKTILYLFFFPDLPVDETSFREWTLELFEVMSKNVAKRYSVQITVGVSEWKSRAEDLTEAVSESKMALYQKKRTPGVRFFSREYEQGERRIYLHFRNEYLSLISSRKEQCAQNCLEKFLSEFIKKKKRQEIQLYCADFLYQISKSNRTADLIITSTTFWDYYKDLLLCVSSDQMAEYVIKQCSEITKQKKTPMKVYHKYIESSLLYMREHYMEGISLEQVAQASNITSFYLSKLFKQELNHTFLEILTDIRIKNSIEFLYCGNYTVQEISELIGYPNSNYFYKVFKKHTGITLGKIREYIELFTATE